MVENLNTLLFNTEGASRQPDIDFRESFGCLLSVAGSSLLRSSFYSLCPAAPPSPDLSESVSDAASFLQIPGKVLDLSTMTEDFDGSNLDNTEIHTRFLGEYLQIPQSPHAKSDSFSLDDSHTGFLGKYLIAEGHTGPIEDPDAVPTTFFDQFI